MTPEFSLAVINTSPWISLCLCGQIDLLSKLYKTVMIPLAVRREIEAGGRNQIGVKELEHPNWLKTVGVSDSTKVSLLHELDQGEAEVIILAKENNATEVIIDEKVARMQAKILGLEVVGTLGLLLRAKKYGLISEIGPLIQNILEGGIYIHKNIVEGILREAGK